MRSLSEILEKINSNFYYCNELVSWLKYAWNEQFFTCVLQCSLQTSGQKMLVHILGVPTFKSFLSDRAGRFTFCSIFHEDPKNKKFVQDWTYTVHAPALPGLSAKFFWAGNLGRACALMGVVWSENQNGFHYQGWKTRLLRMGCDAVCTPIHRYISKIFMKTKKFFIDPMHTW